MEESLRMGSIPRGGEEYFTRGHLIIPITSRIIEILIFFTFIYAIYVNEFARLVQMFDITFSPKMKDIAFIELEIIQTIIKYDGWQVTTRNRQVQKPQKLLHQPDI